LTVFCTVIIEAASCRVEVREVCTWELEVDHHRSMCAEAW
jgi:hypothetical protein